MIESAESRRRLVVDTSVVAKWYLPESHAELAQTLLDERNKLYAPDFVSAELGNVVVTNARAGRINADRAKAIFHAFARVPLELLPVTELAENAFVAALDTGRSFYDCVYLALAIQTGSLLVTADLRFYNAIRRTSWAPHCMWIEDIS